MNFEELGHIFKQEREKRGLSIKEVMEVTKISRRNIIALEEGNSEDLPHPVYAKGFVRSYARFLGLDGDELARAFDFDMDGGAEELEITQYDVTPGTDLAFQETDSGSGGKKSSLPAILLIILLLGVLGGLVYYFGFHQKAPVAVETSAVEPITPKAASSVEAPQGASRVEETLQPTSTTSESGQPSAEKAEADESTPQAVEAAPAAEQPETTDAQPEEPVAVRAEEAFSSKRAKAEEGEEYKHVLVIRAIADEGCWIGVWKSDDEAMIRDFFLRKGEPLRLKFNSFRRIRIGNVPGVTITYNGNAYPMDTSKGKTQDLRFGQ